MLPISFSQKAQWGVTFLKSFPWQARPGCCNAGTWNQGEAEQGAELGWGHCREVLGH